MNATHTLHIARRAVPPAPQDGSRDCRFLLYSHDSYGLGHLRRNLLIAGALLQRFPRADVVILTGSPCATQYPLPPHCDVIKIPAIGKDREGRYVPRGLGLSLDKTLALRRQLILAAYESYDPDIIIVDHQPTGLLNEMQGVLRRARKAGKFVVFGMRDIVDSPHAVERAWSSPDCKRAFERYYDRLFVYGDRRVFDPVEEYRILRPLADKISTLGYIAEPQAHPAREPSARPGKHILVTVGGGDDGVQRIETYMKLLRLEQAAWTSHVVTGPLMPLQQVRKYKHEVKHSDLRGRVKVSRFHGDIPGLMHQADAVVSMAGYNSCLEVLQSGTPAILVPRTLMRQEQSIRASRLAAMGLVRSVPANDPERLLGAIGEALRSGRTPKVTLNLDGLANVCDTLAEALGLQVSRCERTAKAAAMPQTG